MNISSIIEKAIRDEYRLGATQDELGRKYGVSQQHICDLLSKKRAFNKLEIATVEKMFPNAQISLSGEIGNNSPNSVIGNNFLPKNEEKSKTDTDLIQQKIKSIMSNSELTAEEKVKFTQILIGE